MVRNIELLAPAGTMEALFAAIQNGANAVYIGGSKFGARAYAGNFSNEEIISAVKYAHIRDVKIYVTVNTLISDKEFDECLDFIDFLYHNDVDAVILQDIGLAAEVKRRYPDFELHASTQMSISNSKDALYYKNMGFTRVVLARENTVDEIEKIYQNTGLEIESFVHGALCVSYSGKCLFSFANGGRSGNQGSCAQPCRKKYHFKSNNQKQSFDYFLSTKDLCTIKNLEQIINKGTYSLKIEGRMKRPEYVATVVRSYRKAIDSIQKKESVDLELLEQEMASVFNRQFTSGLILNVSPKDIGNSASPNNVGIVSGKVTRVLPKQNKIEIALEAPLSKGDGLSLGEHVGRILIGDRIVEHAQAGQKIMLDYRGDAKPGDIVRKTSDKSLIQRSIQSYEKEHIKIPLKAFVNITKGNYPQITIRDNRENVVEYYEISAVAEEAQNHELTLDEISQQIHKTEGTPFFFESVDIRLEPGCFLRKATLNSLRRAAIDAIMKRREVTYQRNLSIPKREMITYKKASGQYIDKIRAEMLSVKCFTKDQIEACKEQGILTVYVCDENTYFYAKKLSLNVFFSTPIMLKDNQIEQLENFIKENKPNLMTTSVGFAEYIVDKMSGIYLPEIRMDYLSNCINAFSFEEMNRPYIQSVTISPEHPNLLKEEILHSNNAEFPILIHPILMVTEFCPYKTSFPCAVCHINEGTLISQDYETQITLKRDAFCRMQLIGNKPMDFSKGISNSLKSGIRRFRIDLLDESKNESISIIQKYLGK